MRPSGRKPEQMRKVQFIRHFTQHAEGSVLTEFGDTRVIRTASISGAYVALSDAIDKLLKKKVIARNPIHGTLASVSVGIYQGTPVLDLDYAEDANAETDMNVVMNDAGAFIEIQGTAEGHAFRKDELQAMLTLAERGIGEIMQAQHQALGD